jgi:ketosteroid isomerase-like protein
MWTLKWVVICTLMLLSSPTPASWQAGSVEVEIAAKTPRIAAALAATERMDRAILARDSKEFADVFADDAVVNNPFNRIARKADAVKNLETGLINYTSLHRNIEYAAERGDHEVILMGEEILTPVGKAKFAGETIKRRTTEIWNNASGEWKLAVRQATVYRNQ